NRRIALPYLRILYPARLKARMREVSRPRAQPTRRASCGLPESQEEANRRRSGQFGGVLRSTAALAPAAPAPADDALRVQKDMKRPTLRAPAVTAVSGACLPPEFLRRQREFFRFDLPWRSSGGRCYPSLLPKSSRKARRSGRERVLLRLQLFASTKLRNSETREGACRNCCVRMETAIALPPVRFPSRGCSQTALSRLP